MNKVINFHEVRDAHWFESVVIFLKEKFEMVSAQDIHDYFYKGKKLKNACLITVDDGHETSYSVIYPILKKHNVPAIFFVSPQVAKNTDTSIFWFQAVKKEQGWISGISDGNMTIDEIWDKIDDQVKTGGITLEYRQNMSVDQIKRIDAEGLVAIGAHTNSHPFLARESDIRSQSEIVDSITQLEKLLGHPIRYFAYPNGRPVLDFGEREMDILRSTNVKLSFSTQHANFSRKSNPYAIPRYGLTTGSMRFIRLKLFLGQYYLLIKKLIKQFT